MSGVVRRENFHDPSIRLFPQNMVFSPADPGIDPEHTTKRCGPNDDTGITYGEEMFNNDDHLDII